MLKHRIGRLGICLAVCAAFTVGCAEEREPINRVQANALKKSFFVGAKLQDSADDPEFWAQGTLVDVGGYGASQDGLFTSTYAQPLSRIKWIITEDMLIGRATYERVEDADGKGTGPASNDGTVAYMYPIQSHFDIRRAYNPSTGEELNVVEENTSDRAWFEREFMRVDWSRNLATGAYDFDTLSLLGVFGGVSYEPISYYVNDPEDNDAPYFDSDKGYFDVTNKAFASPKQIDLSSFGWGIDKYPACFLPNDFMHGSWPSGSCNPVELTIRQSFRKVEKSDFEPVDWDGWRFQAYGAFNVERFGYSRNYGMSDQKWHRMINRYDLYTRHHYYADPEGMTGEVACYTPQTTPNGANPHRDDNQDGTEDECEAVTAATQVGGSRCDTFTQKCTLPYRLRTAKVITWYYTDDSNNDFFEPTAEATHEWDVALRSAMRSAQYAECVSTGGAADQCAGQFPTYFGQQDENSAAVKLSIEIDACRAQNRGNEAACDGAVEQVGNAHGASPGVRAIAAMPEALVLCHSPVEAGDHPACAPADKRLPAGVTAAQCASIKTSIESVGVGGLSDPDRGTWNQCKAAQHARRGDLRYHQVNVITEPQTPSPWGIYVDAEDPLTGEKVAASINVWSHVNDQFSQKVVDIARYIKGELKTEDVTEGTHIRDWAAASEAASKGGMAPRLTKAEAQKRIANFAGAKAADVDLNVKLPAEMKQKLQQVRADLNGVAAALDAPTSTKPLYNARRELAKGTQVEAELVTKQMQEYAGVAELPADLAIDQASILRGANPQFQRDIRNFKEAALAHRGACIMHEAPAPMSLTGLADILEEKFGAFDANQSKNEQADRAEKMRKYVARRAHYAVILHEMGHSIGLRHNFVSSSDAWGYRPQYWQLRTKNLAVTNACNGVNSDPETCVGPRYFDPMTENERKNLIWTWQHSSVMDYAGELTQDFLGLGAYDFAAARMFYGDIVSVFADPSYNAGTPRGTGMLAKMDNFGGILGMQPQIGPDSIHYSELPQHYDLISNCREVDPNVYRPSTWNDEADGFWHPVLDGGIVAVDGKYTVCDQPKVDYVPWTHLRRGSNEETKTTFHRGGPSVDRSGRLRLPYGFASDGWADLGNASVYRHDNGGDTYEIFDFLITQQEVFHIFDNYRRGRQDFSVRSAANRTLGRYNEKIRDGAKGLGLIANIYRQISTDIGWDFDHVWPYIANDQFDNNVLASGVTFDHFARMMARPEPGQYYVTAEKVLRSMEDANVTGNPVVTIPNGATGYLGDVGAGGKLLENRLSDQHGEYDRDYTINSGAYYDKVFTSMLMTESVDNFISDSRTDFLDARYRSVSLADLFPDGYRRFLANNLTGDDVIKGARLAALPNGFPSTGPDGFPAQSVGWTTWWTEEPESCFPVNGTTVCSTFGGQDVGGQAPAATVAVDPQVGWEQQKFLIAWTLMYLPENQKQNWINMMQLWELGKDSDPGFPNRIEFHHPNGKVYVAQTFGKEVIFGKSVQRGVAARVLEWANALMAQAYVTTPGPDLDGDGSADWVIAALNPATGQPLVKYDPAVLNAGTGLPTGTNPNCTATNNSGCTCSSNRACGALESYVSVPFFMRQALSAYGIVNPDQKGVY